MAPHSKTKPPKLRREVERTPQTQIIYNRIREEEDRHSLQHHVNSQNLRPPPTRSLAMSPSMTNESRRNLEVPGPDPGKGKRPRGRRHRPLDPAKKFKTAIKRALKLVCHDCRAKKVTCECYDFSKLEEAYQAGQAARAEQLASHDPAPAPTPQYTSINDLLGIDGGWTTPVALEDDLGELTDPLQQPSAPQRIRQFVSHFGVDSVPSGPSIHQEPTDQQAYRLPNVRSDSPPALSVPFPIGSEMFEYPGRWRCEFFKPDRPTPSIWSDECSWTGPMESLELHFRTDHHSFQDPEFWCQCEACHGLVPGEEPPRVCENEECYGMARWKRWYYGHMLVESVAPSTQALTQYTESESGYSHDHRGPWDRACPGGGGGSYSFGSFSGGNSNGHCRRSHASDTTCETYHDEFPDESSPHPFTLLSSPISSVCSWTMEYKSRSPFEPSEVGACRLQRLLGSRRHAWLQLQFFYTLAMSLLVIITLDAGCLSQMTRMHAGCVDVRMSVPILSAALLLSSFMGTWLVKHWISIRGRTQSDRAWPAWRTHSASVIQVLRPATVIRDSREPDQTVSSGREYLVRIYGSEEKMRNDDSTARGVLVR
ncbi:uncharacterized protein BCR38DRAFT_158580 [Pseudomassariella vexata]|uniref:Uncharacterized protein n=1 Tax=Pseudomassariella vexata TaxID=1141098 RepID=A0A1Y2E799_9PEZI|nr:uncharacterized protein BCR38DRAFT_158580 [Pseudomassariella vexata]ORY67453.1 hypothetical protein BCR38DRAFT_158580 [Pseudomassariella vexata]